MTTIKGLFSGALHSLPPEGQQTGIFKDPVEEARVDVEGIIGDRQADRRYHGGPEKALHQYSLHAYETMLDVYPQLQGEAIPGSMGENISSAVLNDSNVCIGDIYRIGGIVVQVSQPRTPCWKINHRFGIEKLSKLVEERKITGWYYRVLETGRVHLGDAIELLEQPNEAVSIEYFLSVRNQHRPELGEIDTLIHCTGLNEEWKNKLLKRRAFLERLV